ncbi:hypothetical protein ABT256_11165 [Amycolatopsis japonica]|uniref:hypothetical protein n=1 Tax=Amycolatopsis japonica TaxID=208439 RepID=UPI00332B6D0A
MSDELSLTDLGEISDRFEHLILEALKEKYPQNFFEREVPFLPVLRWNTRTLLGRYIESNSYPNDRAAKFLFNVIDFKLQLYYILESDVGLYNHLYEDELAKLGLDSSNPTPRLLLRRLSFDQNLIGKSRILWERLMNLIYYLEEGKELDGKSKKGKFFRWLRESADRKWLFMAPYEEVLVSYDQQFRTPEFHKGSVLRAELLGQKSIDVNDLLDLVNRASNVILENLTSILEGRWPAVFTDVHALEGQPYTTDPKYLEQAE